MRRLVVCAMALGFGATITAQQGGASGVRAPGASRQQDYLLTADGRISFGAYQSTMCGP